MKKIAICGLLTACLISSSAFGQGDQKKRGARGPQRQGAFDLDRMIGALDKDKDGTISLSEAPERMKPRFEQMDRNQDGALDKNELKMAFARRMAAGGGPAKGAGANKKGTDAARPNPARGGFAGRGMDLAKMFKDGDTNGDGNLDPAEQKAIVAKFNEMMSRVRRMRGNGSANQKKKGNNPYNRPNTDPVKPKRPGK